MSTTLSASRPPEQSAARSLRRRITSRYGIVVVWIAMSAIFAALAPQTFLTFGTFQTIFGSQSTLVFLGMAAVCIFVVGEFDLSIASMMGLSATVLAVLVVNQGVPEWLAVIIALVVGAAAGAVNGFVIVRLGIDPIVTTLGMSVLLLGVAQAISNLVAVTGLSFGLANLAVYNILGLPLAFYYGLIVAIIFALVLAFTPLGRHMTFVGANREVARLSGIPVQRIRYGAYVFSGLSSAVAGVLLAASVGGFDSSTSGSYLLPALAATFLGTAVVRPGTFNPIGTLITIYFLVTGIVGLQLLGYSSWVSNVFYGAALIIAVTISTIARSRLLRR
ncbi:ABC transporter permease [Lacisediminihabitans profunda]|uniref:Autoinducer 2 import system permease protein LsrD n=1 Tax=Lacisediminihabitans profunda TaxID=2594790 RepID=A0A5C8UM69_9MICO|nr:ABC transporter permease [Lacisediminihabitans profunda]TXN29469.1 ABC transporter permease [Lacisediminihabitans profunda]